MPTYEYECLACGHRFEKFQQMSAEKIRQCPRCKGQVERVIGTGAGIIVKNSGFHASKQKNSGHGTCCGREERCDKPPCSDDGLCKR